MLNQGTVVIISAQCRVAPGGKHFKHATREAQDGDVEGAAPQVVHGVHTFAGLIQAIRNGSRRGLVDQTQHVQTGQLRRVFGGLAVRIVKVGRYGDDGTVQVVVEGVFGAKTQSRQDFGAHFHRRLVACAGVNRQHAGFIDELVRQLVAVGDVGHASTHETLDRHQGVLWIVGLRQQSGSANLTAVSL